MNRKGDERVLSLYWFVIFIIIAAAVTGGTYLFFSHPIDVREVEVSMLADRVIDCFVERGRLNEELLGEISSENFEERCGLVFGDSFEGYKGDVQYYVEVSSLGNVVGAGDDRWKSICTEEAEPNVPTCARRRLMVLNEAGDFAVFDVLSSVRKVEQNA